MVSIDRDKELSRVKSVNDLLDQLATSTSELAGRCQDMLGDEAVNHGSSCESHLRTFSNRVKEIADNVPAVDNDAASNGFGGGGGGGGGMGGPAGGGGGGGTAGGGEPVVGATGIGVFTSNKEKIPKGGPVGPTGPDAPNKETEKLIAKYGVLHPEDCPCVFHSAAYRDAVNNPFAWTRDTRLPRAPWPYPTDNTGPFDPSGPIYTSAANGILPGGCIPPPGKFPTPIEMLPPHGSDCPCPYHKTGSYPSPSGPIPFPPNGPLDPLWNEPLPDPTDLPTIYADGSATDPWPDGPPQLPPDDTPDPQVEILRDRVAELELQADQNQFDLEIQTQRLTLNGEKDTYLEQQAAGLESARDLLIAQGAPPVTVAAVDFALRLIDDQRAELADEAAQIKDEITSLEKEEDRLNRELEQAKADLDAASNPDKLVATERSEPIPTQQGQPAPAPRGDQIPPQQGGPTPPQQGGPTSPERSDPSPAERGDPSPAERSDPSPAERSDPSPAERSDPSPAERSDPSPAERSDPSPAERSDPSPAERSDPSPAERGEQVEVNRNGRVVRTPTGPQGSYETISRAGVPSGEFGVTANGTAEQPMEWTQTIGQPMEPSQTIRQPMEWSQTIEPPIERNQTIGQPMERGETIRQPMEWTQTIEPPMEPTQTIRQPMEWTQTIEPPIERGRTIRPPMERGETIEPPTEWKV